jgi:hypothetical protein
LIFAVEIFKTGCWERKTIFRRKIWIYNKPAALFNKRKNGTP